MKPRSASRGETGSFSLWQDCTVSGDRLVQRGGRYRRSRSSLSHRTNGWVRIHDRIPAILQDDVVDTWLNPTPSDPEDLTSVLKAPSEDFLKCYPVEKSLLNSGLIDTPECADNIGRIMRHCCARESEWTDPFAPVLGLGASR